MLSASLSVFLIVSTSSRLAERKRKSTSSSLSITILASFKSLRTKASILWASILSTSMPMGGMAASFRGAPSRSVHSATISAISAAWSPMRSRSPTILREAEIRRRSRATGCWLSKSRRQRVSISFIFWSISLSPTTIFLAVSRSKANKASMEAFRESSTRAPISIMPLFRASSCESKRFLINQISR